MSIDVPFIEAAHRRAVSRTPVWFMRQAGRSLPEYRAARGEGSILQAIKQPDVAAAITLQPVQRYGVDAAVLFSDIVVPAHAVGFGIDVAPGTGPVAEQPLRSLADLARLRPLDADHDTSYVVDTVRLLAAELPDHVPLLAFAGAPFTVASYLIEGRPSKTYQHTKQMMHTEPAAWHAVMERLVQHSVAFISAQLRAGARAFQLFDSWAGSLSRSEYESFVLPYSRTVFEQLGTWHPGTPGIHYGVGCDHLLESMLDAARGHGHGTPVLGLDWRTSIRDARRRMGDDLVVQGNLDPALVLAGAPTAMRGVDAVLADNAGNAEPGAAGGAHQHLGHIFNLGHGVQPDTDPGVLAAIVERVHTATAVAAASNGAAS